MGIQIASVSIGTKLDLNGFNQGLGSISSVKTPVVKVGVRFDNASIEQERQRLEQLLSRNLTVKVGADDSELMRLNKHIESKRSHVKDVNAWFERNPIKPRVDTSELQELEQRTEKLNKRIIDTAKTTQTQQSVQKTEPSTTSTTTTAKSNEGDIAKAISKLKSSNRGVVGSVFSGAFENLGRQVTSKFSEGLTDSVESALSSKIGSLDLVGRSIVERVIPGIGEAFMKAPIAQAVKKGYSESELAKTVEQSVEFVQAAIGKEQIEIEKRLLAGRKRTAKTTRNESAAKELGIEYQDVLGKQGLNEIQKKQGEDELKKLEKYKQQLEKNLADYMSQSVSERGEEYFNAAIQSQKISLGKIQIEKEQLSKKLAAFEAKENTKGLSEQERQQKILADEQLKSLSKRENAGVQGLSELQGRQSKFRRGTDVEKEAMLGSSLEAKTKQLGEVEKQIEQVRTRVEKLGSEKQDLEKLLEAVGVKGAGRLEGVRALRDVGISQKKEATDKQRDELKDKLSKAQQVLEASNGKILKYQGLLKKALADSDDNTVLAVKALIEKEVNNRNDLEKLITNVKTGIDKLDKAEINFIKNAEASVPQAEAGVIKETGVLGSVEEINKNITTSNVKNIGEEYQRLLGKLKNLEFESKDEMASALKLMEAMNGQIGAYEKQADEALKGLEQSKKISKLPDGQQPDNPFKAHKKTNKTPALYRDVIEEVAKISGVSISDEQIPHLESFTKAQIDKLKKQNLDVKGGYIDTKNKLKLQPEDFNKISNDVVTDDLIEVLVHELRHGIQSNFGQFKAGEVQKSAVELIRPSAEEYKNNTKLARHVEGSTSNFKDKPDVEQFVRATEQDAYIFTERNKEAIKQKVARKASVRKIEQIAGSGGGKLLNDYDNLQESQLRALLEKNNGAKYDTSQGTQLLAGKFKNLKNLYEPYIEKLQNIDALPQEELDKLYKELQIVVEKVSHNATSFADKVHNELLENAKQDLLKQLTGGYTTKDELKDIAKSHGVGVSGTKEQVAARLVNNVDINKLRDTIPQLTPHQRGVVSKADQLTKTPDLIKPQLQERIKVARGALTAIKQKELPQISYEEIKDDYHMVLELVNRDLEKDVKNYLKGARLQLGNITKDIEKIVLGDIVAEPQATAIPKIETTGIQEQILEQVVASVEHVDLGQLQPVAMPVDSISELSQTVQEKTAGVVEDIQKQVDNYDWDSLFAEESAKLKLEDVGSIAPQIPDDAFSDWDSKLSLNVDNIKPESIGQSIEQGAQAVVDDFSKQIDNYDWDSLLAQESSSLNLEDIAPDTQTENFDDWDAKFAQSFGMENLGTGLSQGIEKSIPKADAASVELAESVTEAAKKELEIKSPSRVFERLGRFVVEGFNKGVGAVKAAPSFAGEFVENSKQKVQGTIENLANRRGVNRGNKANSNAASAMSQVYSAALNQQTSAINKAMASFDEYEAKQFKAAQEYIEERQKQYQQLLDQADQNIQSADELELANQNLQGLQGYQKNAKLLSQQELKGNVINTAPIISPQKVAQASQKAEGDFTKLIGEALADLFGGIAQKVKKQAEILKMHTPSLMADLVTSANEAELGGDKEESSRLLEYKNKLATNNDRAVELTRKVKLSPDEIKELQELNIATQDIFKSLNVAVPQVNTFFDALFRGSGVAGNLLQGLKGLVGGFLAFRGMQFFQNLLASIAPASLEAAVAMESLERRFLFVSGNAQQAAKSLAFVKSEVSRLGTDMKSSMEGFVSLGAATRDTSLENQTEKIFSGVSQASTVYDLTGEQQSRVFTAVQQIAGKGKVSAEELRQQLGEVLPGAFQIAARAMGMTTKALDKMMSEGKLLSEDFLPKFAQQLSAETATGVKGAANSSVSALIGFNNALFEMQAALGKSMLPVRNLLLTLGGGAIKFVTENADLLLGVFRAIVVMAGVKMIQSFGSLATALMKIPGVASAASAAMMTFQKISGGSDNKLKATDFVENIGNSLQNIKANPAQSIKAGAGNALAGAKNFGIAMLENTKGGISALGESLVNLQKNGLSNLAANFKGGAIGVQAFGKAALVNGVAGFVGLASGARALMAAIAPMLTMFLVIEVGMRVFQGISAAFKDASGDSRDFADTATDNLQKYRTALAEARGETEKFKDTKLVRDESLLDQMGLGALLPKEIKSDAGWFDKLRFGTGKALTGIVESPANLLKTVSGGKLGATYEDKKLADNLNATGEARTAVNSTTSEALSLLGAKGQGVKELGQLKQYDDQLRQIQTRRAALVAMNPQDKAGLKAIDEQQTKILDAREKVSKPIGILQSNMQSNIDGIKKEIEKYQKLADAPGKNQAQYKEVLKGLQGDLESAEKVQDRFNRAVGESVNAFSLMQRNIQGVVDKLADAEDKAVVTGNALKSNLYSNAKSQGELQFGLSEIDIQQQEEKVRRLVDAQNQTKALLQNKDAQATLQAYGVNENTGRAELKTIADKAGDRANDKYVIEQYSALQERSVEISNLQSGLAQAKYEMNQKVVELNKQINEYYRTASRQFAESSIEFQRQAGQLKTQTYATELKTAISGFEDNIVSQFVDSIIESVQQLSDAADKQLDVESAVLQANNQFEDAVRQGEELRKQLPKYVSGSSGSVPTIPVELDFSGIPTNSDLTKLNAEVGKTVDSTKDLNDITKDYDKTLASASSTIEENKNITTDLSGVVKDVSYNVGDLNSGLESSSSAIKDTASSTQDLNSEVQNTTTTAQDLGYQIDTNTEGINSNTSAVQETNANLSQSVAQTTQVSQTTTQWWEQNKLVFGTIATSINPAIGAIALGLGDLIAKTVDWFKTFANNVPVLNQLGQIFNSWGQQLASVGQNISNWAQGVGQNISGAIQQGVETVQGALGLSKDGSGKVTEKYRTGTLAAQEYGAPRPGRKHAGQDIDVSGNQQAQSFIGGIVTRVVHAQNGKGYGSYVDVFNKQLGVVERIAEVMNVFVKEGQQIKPGQAIGGGESRTGVFHYEIRKPVDAQGRGGYGYEGTQDPIKFYEKLGIAKREGQQIKILSGLNAGQTLNAAEHGVGDGHNHFGEDDVKAANQQQASAIRKSQVLLERTGIKDDKGLEKLKATVFDSQGKIAGQFTANSGKADKQNLFGGAGSTKSGSNAPLEYGKYNIGSATAGSSAAVGKTFVPIQPQFKTQRSSLGIHFDADRPVGAGSAGCIVFATEAEFNAFRKAIAQNGVNSLVFEGQNVGNSNPKTIAGKQAVKEATPQPQPAKTSNSRFTMPLPTGGNLKSGAGQNVPSWMPKMSWQQHKQFLVNQAMSVGITDPNQIKYLLATAQHETGEGNYMREGGSANYLSYLNNKLGNKGNADAVAYRGAGYSQLTGKSNFVKWSPIVSQHFGQNIDLVNNPDLAAHPDIAAFILAKGMKEGTITGRAIGKYVDTGAGKVDFRNARRTINGIDPKQLVKIDKVLAGISLDEVKAMMAKAQAGGGGVPLNATQQTAANAAMGAASAGMPIPQIQQVATPTVWTPGSYSPASAVSAKGNTAIDKVTGQAEIQRARAIEMAQQKAVNEAAQGTATALRGQSKALRELEKGLRENGIKVSSLSNEVTDTNLEYKDALNSEEKRLQGQRKLDQRYSELENNIVEQRRSIQAQVDTAKTLLSKGGVVSPEMKQKIQKLVDDPNIKENLREQLKTALSTGALGQGGQDILQRAAVEGEQQLKKLDSALGDVRKGRGESKKLLDEKFAREEATRKQQAGFDIESASLDTLKAKLEQLQALKDRTPFAPEVQGIPALQQVISAREEQLKLEQQLKDIDEKERNKVYTKEEANKLRTEVKARKEIVDTTIKQNTEQAKLVLQREQDTRNREAANDLAQAELAKDKQKLEQLKLIAQTNPLAPELKDNAIGVLEQRIALREAELQLAQELAAIEQSGFEGKRTPEEVTKLKAEKQAEFDNKIANINKQAEQAAFANDIQQQKTLLEIKQQQLDYQNQIVDATVKGINLGTRKGDPLKIQYDQQKAGMELSVEKQVLEMKEFANRTGKSKEEVAALEEQIRGLNNLNLENLKAEFDKSIADRAFGVRQRLGSSQTELLDTQASFYAGRGMNFKAQSLQRQSAMAQQQMSYEGQRRDLEEFIRSNQVASDEAERLRGNLEQVNQVKFDTIKDNFNAFKPVIDSVQGGLKNFFSGLIKGGQSIEELFNGLMDSILGSVAELASNYLVEQLFGGLMGGKKNEGQGGMFAKGDKEKEGTDPLSSILGGLGGTGDKSTVGLSPVAPMYVNVVNAGAMGAGGGLTGGLSNIFSGGEDTGFASSGGDFMSSLFSGSIFGGGSKIDKGNPFPVGIEKSAPDAFSGITNALGGLFGGGGSGGGLGGIIGSVGGLFGGGGGSGGGGGGLGGILGMIMPLFGGLFYKGGIVGNYAGGGLAGNLGKAIRKEKAMNGGKKVAVAALTHGERVLNLNQTKNLDKLGGVGILNFADGGMVGGYVPDTGEYGGAGVTDKVAGKAAEPRKVSVNMETRVINGVEYLTKEQGEQLAQKAAQEGAQRGAQYIQDKSLNSVSFRNKMGWR